MAVCISINSLLVPHPWRHNILSFFPYPSVDVIVIILQICSSFYDYMNVDQNKIVLLGKHHHLQQKKRVVRTFYYNCNYTFYTILALLFKLFKTEWVLPNYLNRGYILGLSCRYFEVEDLLLLAIETWSFFPDLLYRLDEAESPIILFFLSFCISCKVNIFHCSLTFLT